MPNRLGDNSKKNEELENENDFLDIEMEESEKSKNENWINDTQALSKVPSLSLVCPYFELCAKVKNEIYNFKKFKHKGKLTKNEFKTKLPNLIKMVKNYEICNKWDTKKLKLTSLKKSEINFDSLDRNSKSTLPIVMRDICSKCNISYSSSTASPYYYLKKIVDKNGINIDLDVIKSDRRYEKKAMDIVSRDRSEIEEVLNIEDNTSQSIADQEEFVDLRQDMKELFELLGFCCVTDNLLEYILVYFEQARKRGHIIRRDFTGYSFFKAFFGRLTSTNLSIIDIANMKQDHSKLRSKLKIYQTRCMQTLDKFPALRIRSIKSHLINLLVQLNNSYGSVTEQKCRDGIHRKINRSVRDARKFQKQTANGSDIEASKMEGDLDILYTKLENVNAKYTHLYQKCKMYKPRNFKEQFADLGMSLITVLTNAAISLTPFIPVVGKFIVQTETVNGTPINQVLEGKNLETGNNEKAYIPTGLEVGGGIKKTNVLSEIYDTLCSKKTDSLFDAMDNVHFLYSGKNY